MTVVPWPVADLASDLRLHDSHSQAWRLAPRERRWLTAHPVAGKPEAQTEGIRVASPEAIHIPSAYASGFKGKARNRGATAPTGPRV
jgi:hypothetical protein